MLHNHANNAAFVPSAQQSIPGPCLQGQIQSSHISVPPHHMLNQTAPSMIRNQQQTQPFCSVSQPFPAEQMQFCTSNVPGMQHNAGMPFQGQMQGQLHVQMMTHPANQMAWQAAGGPAGGSPCMACPAQSTMFSSKTLCHGVAPQAQLPPELVPTPLPQTGPSRERSRSPTRRSDEGKPQSTLQTDGEHV